MQSDWRSLPIWKCLTILVFLPPSVSDGRPLQQHPLTGGDSTIPLFLQKPAVVAHSSHTALYSLTQAFDEETLIQCFQVVNSLLMPYITESVIEEPIANICHSDSPIKKTLSVLRRSRDQTQQREDYL